MPVEQSTTVLFICPKCGIRQNVYVGRMDDETVPDTDAAKCYSCGAVECWIDEAMKEVLGGEENWNVETGIPLKG